MKFARVDLSTNRLLATQFESGELGNTVYGVLQNGLPVVNQLPCWMLLLNGKRVQCQAVSGELPTAWRAMERSLVKRLWSEVNRGEIPPSRG